MTTRELTSWQAEGAASSFSLAGKRRIGSVANFVTSRARPSLLEDGDVWVGVFPECEEILIGRPGFSSVSLHGVGAAKAKMREAHRWVR